MPADPNIGNREREILTAIVETFISTGEPVVYPQRDGRSVGRWLSRAAACFGWTCAHDGGVSLLCRADLRHRSLGAAGGNHDLRLACRHHRRARVHGAHLACAITDFA